MRLPGLHGPDDCGRQLARLHRDAVSIIERLHIREGEERSALSSVHRTCNISQNILDLVHALTRGSMTLAHGAQRARFSMPARRRKAKACSFAVASAVAIGRWRVWLCSIAILPGKRSVIIPPPSLPRRQGCSVGDAAPARRAGAARSLRFHGLRAVGSNAAAPRSSLSKPASSAAVLAGSDWGTNPSRRLSSWRSDSRGGPVGDQWRGG